MLITTHNNNALLKSVLQFCEQFKSNPQNSLKYVFELCRDNDTTVIYFGFHVIETAIREFWYSMTQQQQSEMVNVTLQLFDVSLFQFHSFHLLIHHHLIVCILIAITLSHLFWCDNKMQKIWSMIIITYCLPTTDSTRCSLRTTIFERENRISSQRSCTPRLATAMARHDNTVDAKGNAERITMWALPHFVQKPCWRREKLPRNQWPTKTWFYHRNHKQPRQNHPVYVPFLHRIPIASTNPSITSQRLSFNAIIFQNNFF